MLSVVPLQPVNMYVHHDCIYDSSSEADTDTDQLESETISANLDRESPTAEESSF